MEPSLREISPMQDDIKHAEEFSVASQQKGTIDDLRQRLETFHRIHLYYEIEVGGQPWRYVIGGQGERTLLLLPGSLVPDLFFVPIEALERDFRVIVPVYAAVPTMAELVAGVAAILDAERVEHIDVIGSSFGGYVAQCFVRAYPDRVDRLILAETGVRHFVSWAPSISLLASLMSVLPTRLVRFMMWRLWSTLFTPPASQRAFWRQLMREILTTQLTKANFVSETQVLADFSAHYHFRSGDLAAWPGKILILESEQDEAFSPANRARTRAAYPQAQVHTIAKATHSAGTPLYQVRHVLLFFFLWYTRWSYWRLAKEVVRDIEDYIRSGFEVVGIVGVEGSPSCGVCTRLDLGRSLEVVVGCPLARLDRQVMNEEAIAACLCEGEGLFIAAIQRRLKRKHLSVKWYEHDLLIEIRGQPIRLRRKT